MEAEVQSTHAMKRRAGEVGFWLPLFLNSTLDGSLPSGERTRCKHEIRSSEGPMKFLEIKNLLPVL
jgi:hypothetical protein